MTYMDANSMRPEMLAEVMLQQTPPPATSSMLRPIAAVSEKNLELPSEEIVRSGLRSIPEVLQKYPELQTDAKMGVLASKASL